MSNRMNTPACVRQAEQTVFWSERMGNGSPADGATAAPALITQIAASIRRERDRAGLSLTELARRAGIAKSTLSQLESGVGNPGVEALWALGVALGVPFSRLVDVPFPGADHPHRGRAGHLRRARHLRGHAAGRLPAG